MTTPMKKDDANVTRPADSWMTPLSQLRWSMDRLFGDFMSDVSTRDVGLPSVPIEVSETDDEVRVKAEVPGMSPEQIEVELDGDVLTIAGTKHDEREAEENGRRYTERSFGSFRRSIQLPSLVDPEKVSAKHDNGLVTIQLAKSEASRARRIQVQ